MPQPPVVTDYYLVIGLGEHPGDGVWGSAQIWVATAASEEEAVAKIAPLAEAASFVVQRAPAFPRPSEPGQM